MEGHAARDTLGETAALGDYPPALPADASALGRAGLARALAPKHPHAGVGRIAAVFHRLPALALRCARIGPAAKFAARAAAQTTLGQCPCLLSSGCRGVQMNDLPGVGAFK